MKCFQFREIVQAGHPQVRRCRLPEAAERLDDTLELLLTPSTPEPDPAGDPQARAGLLVSASRKPVAGAVDLARIISSSSVKGSR